MLTRWKRTLKQYRATTVKSNCSKKNVGELRELPRYEDFLHFFLRYDTRKNEELRAKYDNIEEPPQDESDEGEQGGRHSISIDDTDASLPIADDDDVDDAGADFHAFWKGEGNARAIREAQGTLLRRSLFNHLCVTAAHTLFKKQIFAAAKIMLKYMDRGADPCEDFYQFACGNWARHNPIPKDKAAYDTFEMIRESLDSVLKELLEDPIATGLDTDDATIKAKYLFQSCMNYGELFFFFLFSFLQVSLRCSEMAAMSIGCQFF